MMFELTRFSDATIHADGWWSPTAGQLVWISRRDGDRYIVSTSYPGGIDPDAIQVRWSRAQSMSRRCLAAIRAYDEALSAAR